jgi:hypothetical protein
MGGRGCGAVMTKKARPEREPMLLLLLEEEEG